MNNFLPFSKPCIDQATIDEVVDCIQSGWLATGPRVQEFAKRLQQYLGASYAVPLTSGTAALHVALLGFDLQPGDEVILPSMTFVACANMIVQAGGVPVFVDVDLGTLNLTVDRIEAAITEKTKVIMPVHFAGLPVDLDPIYALAKKHNLRVLEDAAHAIGAEYKGKRIGSFGDVQIFSFHPNKNMTSGEGGCVTTRDEALARKIRVQSFHGIDRDVWNRFSKQGSQHYDVLEPGFKYNMPDLLAAIGMHQLTHVDAFNERRAQIVQRYYDELKDWKEWQLPAKPSYDCKHVWHLFTPLINEKAAGMTRDEFMTKMKEYDIGTGFHYSAVHLFTYYREKFGYKEGDCPNAESIGQRVVSLPLFPTLTDDEQTRVIEAMRTVFNK
ncbi:MAG: DegT/DnrJ/EryC1/StrS aminotransferase family protein [Pseudomonadota bacterium]|nr:DegT/DnrJ/EryC1/StrS aminotransferase family protein [Gammaproteobacteria bacterium]MBU1927172.1 DegT/DnrJ/EryC1/StrS aminotransferase family protein [Gammaproteobacteria bacterium]MBU2545515.1 DegT/DnrJ/EryC1/StrS aminotransferase family protein [Gammaproteobacteria bacterium]